MDRGVWLVAVDSSARQPRGQEREGVDMVVVATAYDRPLAVLRHDEGERGGMTLRGWIEIPYCAHVLKHPPSQSLATVAISPARSSLHSRMRLTALPPNETA